MRSACGDPDKCYAVLPCSRCRGLGQGARPIIQLLLWSKDTDRSSGRFKLLLKVSLGISILLWILVMLFREDFAAMFIGCPADGIHKDCTKLFIWPQCCCLASRYVPDDLQCAGRSNGVYRCGSHAEVYPADFR